MSQKLCSEGHVIPEGRDACDRDGLHASQDEFGNPITNEIDSIMTDEETVEGAEESPKASEDSSESSSESSEAVADEATVPAEDATEASVASEEEGEVAAEGAAPEEAVA